MLVLVAFTILHSNANASDNNQFVIALVGNGSDFRPKWSLKELDMALTELASHRPKVVIVAYRSGVQALRVDDRETRPWIERLMAKGVVFKVGRESMDLWGLSDDNMPIEIEIVPSGLAEVMMYQMRGYQRLTF